jgi:hypothetical protein
MGPFDIFIILIYLKTNRTDGKIVTEGVGICSSQFQIISLRCMYITRNCLSILLCILIITYFLTSLSYREASVEGLKTFEKENEELKEKLRQRLKRLEPSPPENLQDPPWGEMQFPTKVVRVSEVIKGGTKIPYRVIVDKQNYKRPAYEEHWHSTVGRWSYLPNRVHFALHRLFTNYDIGLSNWYDFEHDIGITVPMFQNEKALDLYIVSFQTQVKNVYTKGNQVVVVGNPNRNGVQVITITTRDVKPTNENENILVQLATQDGYEIDYSLNSYFQPDFWAKQKEKLKESER